MAGKYIKFPYNEKYLIDTNYVIGVEKEGRDNAGNCALIN